MNSAIGFTAIWRGTEQMHARANTALDRALAHFPDLTRRSLQIGETTLVYWGRGDLEMCAHRLPDGSWLALAGSPSGKVTWKTIEDQIFRCWDLTEYRIPWDGRVNLLHVSADGKTWTMWNDFAGAVPVFHSQSPAGRVMSTLEPVVVDATNVTKDDFFLPGVMVFLIHGHTFGEWTLYRDIQKVPADCVIEWTETGSRQIHCNSVSPSDCRCDEGWQNLIDELQDLLKKAVRSTLSASPAWILPLSSGMDSRMIAAAAANTGTRIQAFTWGRANSKEVIHSQRIAKAVGIPWQRVDLGSDYMANDLPLWRDLFGSAIHFHGMYQIPFYNALKALPPMPLASGFLNDILSAMFTDGHNHLYHPANGSPYMVPETWVMWKSEELQDLFRFPVGEAIQTVAERIQEELDLFQGSWHQKMNMLTLRGRQHHFTYFQTTMCDYWRGVGAPYVNRDYANFWLSVPRLAVDHRKLMIEMAKQHYAKVMGIPGTYAREPAILTGRYLLKRRVAKMLPEALVQQMMPEFSTTPGFKEDVASLRKGGARAIWPIPETRPHLDAWIHLDVLDRVYQKALAGDMRSVRKIQTIQTLAYRMM